ncbi:MAG: phosphatidate cytidylyltransferase [Deltaproteobacteria bacterium]|nr:phosphatidate cytidylyltransferase [Deltaproteobacteria bacterium]MBW2586412.1 phosphatidate cytidylyltransferase [Deltaproteobacteria bacterium]
MTDAIEQPPVKKGLSGTALRVATVLPLIPIILWMMFAGPLWVWQTFILAAVALGGYELMAMKVPSSRGLRTWGSVSSVLFAYTIIFLETASAVYGVVLIIILGAMAWSLLQEDPLHNASVRIGWLLGTPVYVGGTLAAVALVREFEPTGAWVLLTMVLAWGSDTSAYFVGRKFGKTKLAPRISPKKTLEGSAGGLMASVVGAVIMSFFLPGLGPIDAVALGILAGGAGQAGDLMMSVLKRSSGVKDSGGILPGHGGILDRVDALTFTAPATWAFGHFIAGF